jgi:hypothetical protein
MEDEFGVPQNFGSNEETLQNNSCFQNTIDRISNFNAIVAFH